MDTFSVLESFDLAKLLQNVDFLHPPPLIEFRPFCRPNKGAQSEAKTTIGKDSTIIGNNRTSLREIFANKCDMYCGDKIGLKFLL